MKNQYNMAAYQGRSPRFSSPKQSRKEEKEDKKRMKEMKKTAKQMEKMLKNRWK